MQVNLSKSPAASFILNQEIIKKDEHIIKAIEAYKLYLKTEKREVSHDPNSSQLSSIYCPHKEPCLTSLGICKDLINEENDCLRAQASENSSAKLIFADLSKFKSTEIKNKENVSSSANEGTKKFHRQSYFQYIFDNSKDKYFNPDRGITIQYYDKTNIFSTNWNICILGQMKDIKYGPFSTSLVYYFLQDYKKRCDFTVKTLIQDIKEDVYHSPESLIDIFDELKLSKLNITECNATDMSLLRNINESGKLYSKISNKFNRHISVGDLIYVNACKAQSVDLPLKQYSKTELSCLENAYFN